MENQRRSFTPVKRRIKGVSYESPRLKDKYGDQRLIKRMEDSCKEKARQRREQRWSTLRQKTQEQEQTNHDIANEILHDIIQDGSFISENDVTQDDYEEMLSFIEEEYDYQCSQLLNEYEQEEEEELQYYESISNNIQDLNGNWIACPRCYEGFISEIRPNYVQCNKCGLEAHRSLKDLQSQFANVYKNHPCGKALQCTLVPNRGLVFSCPECGYNYVLE